MLSKLKKSNNEGFTIIEVMIVLAIAGLILLIVFLAVPALQRNSRNTARKGDVSRVSASVTEFVANQNGTLPAAGDASAAGNAKTIVDAAGTLSQYDFKTNGKLFTVVAAGGKAVAALASVDNIQVVTQAKCNTPNDGSTVAGNARQMALQYVTESASGVTPLCLDI